MEKLVDFNQINELNDSISQQIVNLKPKKEVVFILRTDYEVLNLVNQIRVFGLKGMKAEMSTLLFNNY